MERDFLVRLENRRGFIQYRKEIVHGAEVEMYVLGTNKNKATVFRGPPEADVLLIEKISLYLGRWNRDLVIDENLTLKRDPCRIFMVRVGPSVWQDAWKPGAWVRTEEGCFVTCGIEDAEIFLSRRVATEAAAWNGKKYGVRFDVVAFAEVMKGATEQRDTDGP